MVGTDSPNTVWTSTVKGAAIAAIWRDSKISWTLRYAAVGKLLEEVSKNRTYTRWCQRNGFAIVVTKLGRGSRRENGIVFLRRNAGRDDSLPAGR